MVRGGLLVTAFLAAGLILAGVASAAVYSGETNQSKGVRLLTDDQNELTRITFHRWQSRCQRGGGRFTETSSFIPPLDRSAPGRFADRGSYVLHQDDGNYDIKVKVAVRGKQISPRRWRGVFRPRAVVRRRGDLVARCRPGRIRWRVGLQP